MIGFQPAIVVDALPWWIALPLLQLGLLVMGMALDETYVNRTTVLAGSIALYVHSLVTDGLWLPLSLYMEIGLIVGAYGLYTYVIDGYVGNWFRVLAYFLYSPVAVFLVIVLPDVIFFVGLVIAGYANLKLLEYFRPAEPYYFGPDTNDEFEAILLDEDGAIGGLAGGAGDDDGPADGGAAPDGADRSGHPNAPPETEPGAPAGAGADGRGGVSGGGGPGPAGTAGATGAPAGSAQYAGDGSDPGSAQDRGPSDRGILPEFMRRL